MKNEAKIFYYIEMVKSKKEEDRYKGIQGIAGLLAKGGDYNIGVLIEMIKEAAGNFPKPAGEWDDPSLALVNFVSDYPDPDLIPHIVEHFKGFSEEAKIPAYVLLDRIDSEKSIQAIIEIMEEGFKEGNVEIPTPILYEKPIWAARVMEAFYPYLADERYKEDLYPLLRLAHEVDFFYQFKPNEIIPILINDFESYSKQYSEYDDSYSTKNAYRSWKEKYFALRIPFGQVISLFEYYYNDETEKYIKKGLSFRDPLLLTRAVIVALEKNLEVPCQTLEFVANHMESSEFFYSELLRIRKEHKNPFLAKQPYAAKEHLFDFLVDWEEEIIAEEIEILESIDTENEYGQPVRYYPAVFKHDGEEHLAWVGAYILEEGNDSLYILEGTYIAGPFSGKSMQQHKQDFFKKRLQEREEDESAVHYEEGSVRIIGKVLVAGSEEIPLQEISRVTIQEVKGGLFGLKKTPHVVIYDKEKNPAISFPEKDVDYGEICGVILDQTSHLKKPPLLDFIEFS